MPKSPKSRNGAGKQAKSAEPQAEINGSSITPRDADLLRSFFDRIISLRREQRQLGSEISEIYKEAKGLGYSTASMRDALKLAEMDPVEASMRLDLDEIYYKIARGGAVAIAAAAGETVPLTEAPAWLAGRADALAGHRKSEPTWKGTPQRELEYQLGHDRGVELRQEAAAAIEERAPARKVVRKGGAKLLGPAHLGAQQAAGVKRARRKGAQRPAA